MNFYAADLLSPAPPAGFDRAPWTLADAPGVHECVAAGPGDVPAAAVLAARFAGQRAGGRGGAVLWLQAREAAREWGAPYGLRRLVGRGAPPPLVVAPKSEKQLLWALEEGLAVPALGAVIALLPARERLYGFTASRRLAVRADRHGTAAFIVRGSRAAGVTAATTRWRVAAAPGGPAPLSARGVALPGPARWHLGLERARHAPPGAWLIEEDETHRFLVVPVAADRPAAPPADRRRAAG